MQNSSVTLIARTLYMSSVKDRNPIYANMSYSGYQSWKSRLSERFSPERERITWEGEILNYTGGFSPERELSRLGEK
ncbi:hypothetical protein Lal_00020721 [Lupinus albus]|nr:hypothetical protein Lal_00020721 [Lupinus albus]